MRLTTSLVCLLLIGLTGSALAVTDCPHPGITSVAVTPNTLLGAGLNFDATITFAAAIPQGCTHFYKVTTNQLPQETNVCNFCNFNGDGTNHVKTNIISRVVDTNKTGTITYQAQSAFSSGPVVGNPVATQSLTITPIKISSFTASATTLNSGQNATGTVLMEQIIHNIGGSAKIFITASPATAVTVPASITIQCCTTDNAGHSKGTFTITGRAVAQDTPVTISVKRANQTARTRTITIKH